MTTVNKVTEFRPVTITSIQDIQDHIDAQNADGWQLVCVDNLNGWYRFFWKKDTA
jgi:hypothetical protein